MKKKYAVALVSSLVSLNLIPYVGNWVNKIKGRQFRLPPLQVTLLLALCFTFIACAVYLAYTLPKVISSKLFLVILFFFTLYTLAPIIWYFSSLPFALPGFIYGTILQYSPLLYIFAGFFYFCLAGICVKYHIAQMHK